MGAEIRKLIRMSDGFGQLANLLHSGLKPDNASRHYSADLCCSRQGSPHAGTMVKLTGVWGRVCGDGGGVGGEEESSSKARSVDVVTPGIEAVPVHRKGLLLSVPRLKSNREVRD